MRDLAVAVAAAGHDVTYLTMRHGTQAETPVLAGVRVLGLADAGRVYREERRSIGPPVRFGAAVARHLAAHGSEYDVVHTASFPYFPLLAAGMFRRRAGYRLFVDWHEVWTRDYWRAYAGALRRHCRLARATKVRTAPARRVLPLAHARRAPRERGVPEHPDHPPRALLRDPSSRRSPARWIPISSSTRAARAREAGRQPRPRLRAGTRAATAAASRSLRRRSRAATYRGARSQARSRRPRCASSAAGRRRRSRTRWPPPRASRLLRSARATGSWSSRQLLAATPSVVVAGPENAAVELLARRGQRRGRAGRLAGRARGRSASRARGGAGLRASTARWFEENAPNLLIGRSLEVVLAGYARSRVG